MITATERLREEYPVQVVVRDYKFKMDTKRAPRPEQVPRGASWVDTLGTRTFGFRSLGDRQWFYDTWPEA